MSAAKSSTDHGKRDAMTTEATMSSTSEITVADAIESGADMIRVLRDELAANDTVVETTWAPGALRGDGAALDVSDINTAIALAIATIPAPVNDDGYVAELELARGQLDALDIEAMLRADDEFAVRCDEHRDAWLARVENEDDTCDE
ncbi:MAG: hypothetical protein U0269_25685 [Polyangiales bacterium]